MDDLIERLAAYLHELWAHWFNTQHGVELDYLNLHGSADPKLWSVSENARLRVEKWGKQAGTAYQYLSEEDKEKDRKIAREIFWLLNKK